MSGYYEGAEGSESFGGGGGATIGVSGQNPVMNEVIVTQQ